MMRFNARAAGVVHTLRRRRPAARPAVAPRRARRSRARARGVAHPARGPSAGPTARPETCTPRSPLRDYPTASCGACPPTSRRPETTAQGSAPTRARLFHLAKIVSLHCSVQGVARCQRGAGSHQTQVCLTLLFHQGAPLTGCGATRPCVCPLRGVPLPYHEGRGGCAQRLHLPEPLSTGNGWGSAELSALGLDIQYHIVYGRTLNQREASRVVRTRCGHAGDARAACAVETPR